MMPEINWNEIESKNNKKELIDKLKRLNDQGSFEVTAAEFVMDIDNYSEDDALEFLSDVAKMNYLEKKTRYFCPFAGCVLTEEEAAGKVCPNCENAFNDSDEGVRSDIYFIRHGLIGRDVRWFLALHGMNTRGSWQEEFTWRVATTFRRSIPVAIYKYGIIRPGAVLKWRQRQLMNEMIKKLKYFSGETKGEGFGGKPDIIAHSFGTWLIGHALQKDKSLKVGRLILTGCILRPDFNWAELKKKGQIEAVLNHFGTKDFWAKIAHYIIPDSGPSGRRGFDDSIVINKKAPGFKHSDFFKIKNMKKIFSKIWRPFLQANESKLNTKFNNDKAKDKWKQSNWLIRATIPRYLALGLSLGLLVLLFALIGILYNALMNLIF